MSLKCGVGYDPYDGTSQFTGRPRGFKTPGGTKVIRVPVHLADKILDLAHELDRGGIILDTLDSNATIVTEVMNILRDELCRLAADRKATPNREPLTKAFKTLEQYQARR